MQQTLSHSNVISARDSISLENAIHRQTGSPYNHRHKISPEDLIKDQSRHKIEQELMNMEYMYRKLNLDKINVVNHLNSNN